jgi:hypothetical protein
MLISDDMATFLATSDRVNPGPAVDVWPKFELGAVVLEVLDILFGTEKLRVILGRAKIRKRGKLF